MCHVLYFFIGESGTIHVQGTVSFQRRLRPFSLNLPRAIHWEPRRGSWEQAAAYCSKSETRIDEPHFFGWSPPQPVRILAPASLYPYQIKLRDYLLSPPHERHILWLWEPNGNIGKSAFVKFMAVTYENVIRGAKGKATDLINLAFNADWNKKTILFIDLPRSYGGKCAFDAVEDIKNGYVTNLKYETGEKVFNPPHVVIFANEPPEDLSQVSADRWIIRKIRDRDIIDLAAGQIPEETKHEYKML